MRFVLALLAVIGLLASPVAAVAAQVACSHDQAGAMMSMPMADMPGMAHADGAKADPCCDPAQDHGQSKHSSADCALACAALCGAVAALPSITPAAMLKRTVAAPPPARMASLHPHEPSRLERPPRSIA